MSLIHEVRYAARKLSRTPGFTVVCVVTLALAIGATTAVFSIVNGVLLEPLPFRDPGQVMALGSLNKEGKLIAYMCISNVHTRRWAREEITLLQDVAERTWAAVERPGECTGTPSAAAASASSRSRVMRSPPNRRASSR